MPPIDLTKQQVVEVLAEFEEKLPNIGTKIFEPDRSITSFNLQKINLEASRMLRFMNIGQYVPLVRIEDLSKKSAVGLAYMGDYGDKVFEIEIDERAIRDRDYTYRVLAHEICHKYLELFGLFSKVDRQKDEIRAELCTIFMGFGLLTLNGYKENVGYLNLEDFCHAFCVVYSSRGMSNLQIKSIVPDSCKQYANNILSYMDSIKKVSLSEMMFTQQAPDYELRRKLRILQLVIDNLTEIKDKHQQQDAYFKNRQKELKDGNHPILNALLREKLAAVPYKYDKLEACCAEIYSLVNDLCKATNVDLNAVSESLSKGVVCPACGYVNERTRVNRLKALKCPKCYHYFVWDGRPLKLKTSKC